MRILFAGGFTLGSVTPLLAVIEELNVKCKMQNEKLQIVWVGTRKGPERALMQGVGIQYHWIWAPKLRRYFDWRNLFTPIALHLATKIAWFKLLKIRPDVIVTAGGFVGVPVVWAAWWLRMFGIRIPVLLHNQDVRWSLANKLVAPFVKKITYALPGTVPGRWKKKAVWTGNPVRGVVLDGDRQRGLKLCGFDDQRSTILVVGGGTGAQRLNEIVVEALPELVKKYQVIHIIGRGKNIAPPPQSSPTRGEEAQPNPPPLVGGVRGGGRYCVLEFVTSEMGDLLAAADLVVTRAGMGVLTELAALSKPIVIVPIPGSHQEENARYFEQKRAAIVLNQKTLTSARLVKTVEKLMDELGAMREMSERAQELSKPDAAVQVAKIVMDLAR